MSPERYSPESHKWNWIGKIGFGIFFLARVSDHYVIPNFALTPRRTCLLANEPFTAASNCESTSKNISGVKLARVVVRYASAAWESWRQPPPLRTLRWFCGNPPAFQSLIWSGSMSLRLSSISPDGVLILTGSADCSGSPIRLTKIKEKSIKIFPSFSAF